MWCPEPRVSKLFAPKPSTEPQASKVSDSSTIIAAPYRPKHRPGLAHHLRRYAPIAALVVVALLVILGSWFLFTAKRIEFVVVELDGSAIATSIDITVEEGFSLSLTNLRLMREGEYRILIAAPGYLPIEDALIIDDDSRRFEYRLERLPARLAVSSEPSGATISLDGTEVDTTPFRDVKVPAGTWVIQATLPLYTPIEQEITLEGRGLARQLHLEFEPNFARVRLTSSPSGAEVLVDRETSGITPLEIELEAGSRELVFRKKGYANKTVTLDLIANEAQSPPSVQLEKASASLRVESTPKDAVVLVNGAYQGVSPIRLSLTPERTHSIRVRKTGYEESTKSVTLAPGASKTMRFDLTRSIGEVLVSVWPADSTLLVDGREQPEANTRLQLSSEPHRLEFSRLGYAPVVREITPRAGFTQRVDVRLMTIEDARLARLVPEIKTSSNQTLVLLKPTTIELGASRREAGRRANEVLRTVPLVREFYLATTEVTNAEFRAFAPGHSSGRHAGHLLDGERQPAVGIRWEEAARYCNWLSEQDGLEPVYDIRGATVEGWDVSRSGYRLPTEAEWAWAARYVGIGQALLKTPWGDSPRPPERHGNYADTSATYVVSRVIFGYNDNHIVSAPVASFAPNQHGIFDMGGNVAEWIQDFYEQTPAAQQPPDATGPANGEYHVIRGSSWMHGSVSDLRLSYRDYGVEGRADLGFRIAKYVE